MSTSVFGGIATFVRQRIFAFLTVFFLIGVFLLRVNRPSFNVIPITAFALWMGIEFDRRTSLVSILLLMIASDLLLEYQSLAVMVGVYLAVLSQVFIGLLIGKNSLSQGEKVDLSFMGSVIGTLIFFVLTNGAWWVAWYPHTLAGFITCLIAGLPFLWKNLLENLTGMTIFLGVSATLAHFSRIYEEKTEIQGMFSS
jgi:hypothetical protein